MCVLVVCLQFCLVRKRDTTVDVIYKTNRLGNHTSLTQPGRGFDCVGIELIMRVSKDVCILAEGTIELSVTLSGGALFAS